MSTPYKRLVGLIKHDPLYEITCVGQIMANSERCRYIIPLNDRFAAYQALHDEAYNLLITTNTNENTIPPSKHHPPLVSIVQMLLCKVGSDPHIFQSSIIAARWYEEIRNAHFEASLRPGPDIPQSSEGGVGDSPQSSIVSSERPKGIEVIHRFQRDDPPQSELRPSNYDFTAMSNMYTSLVFALSMTESIPRKTKIKVIADAARYRKIYEATGVPPEATDKEEILEDRDITTHDAEESLRKLELTPPALSDRTMSVFAPLNFFATVKK